MNFFCGAGFSAMNPRAPVVITALTMANGYSFGYSATCLADKWD